ncbi:P-loop ATPase, Sll1717 family [Phaeodactylibacter xiamenensis]|uniref:P-loop ATPase, Sll1717 family n=1 Tax=Phaeodactylibacter xiamenensis TaxID=1524460 RepID=UPI0024A9D223|nr:P-loop NTPase fold protein [Phaeodactylibacter xiamenensis]
MQKREYKFRANVDLGNLEAESDQYLLKGFVPKAEFELLKDLSCPKCIVVGRTGAGKSALLRKLKEEEESVIAIDPEALSLRHLSNSTIINYFLDLDVKLDLFYKVLWRHVFVVEIVKEHFSDSRGDSFRIIQSLKERFGKDRSKKAALDYLEKWEEKFWENTEHQIKEVETTVENAFKRELKGVVKGDATYNDKGFGLKSLIELAGSLIKEGKEGERVLIEVKNKAQKVINELQVDELKSLMQILQKDVLPKIQKKYYIVIDDLDKDWVDSKIVYDLIRALMEVVKEFSRFPQVKIVMALRTNIDKEIFDKNTSRGVQREKIDYLYLNISWTKEELIVLINERLKILMKDTYTNQTPTIMDIIPETTKKHGSAVEYLVDRTLLRPRDMLDFFNKCIYFSNGKTKITWQVIKKAEEKYSKKRLNALEDEWLENYGDLEVLYNLIKGSTVSFKLSDLHDYANSYFVDVITNDKVKNLSEVWKNRFKQFGNDFKPIPLLKEILALLHNVGILGIKMSEDEPLEYIYESLNSIDADSINKSYPKFYVHPTYWKGLKIKSK